MHRIPSDLGAGVAEVRRKVGLYFKGLHAYHAPTDLDPRRLAVETRPLGRYYIDETIPLQFGHWSTFDEQGIPWRQNRESSGFVHNFSTIASYAQARLDMYLLNEEQNDLGEVINCCDYVLSTIDRSDTVWRLKKEELPAQGHKGRVSSIDHGQWMSVLCRAWQLTDRDEYLDTAVNLGALMDVPLADGGVLGYVEAGERLPWYEEETISNFHILNGMICALWGLYDTAIVANDTRANEQWEAGVESVVKALPLFDCGYWSWYGISETLPDYIASMKYHSLHVVQLNVLAEQADDSTIKRYASQFAEYADRPANRLRAGTRMVMAKGRGMDRYRGTP